MIKNIKLLGKKYAWSLLPLCGGILFFCLYQEWLIVHFSCGTAAPTHQITKGVEKKNIFFTFWKDGQWQQEEAEILWSESTAQTLLHIVNRWLSLADEEGVLSQKLLLQDAAISDSKNNAYLSFDRYPFEKESSTYEKYLVIEGLLKTIRQSGLKIVYIHLLVHHKPIQDYHLDFSHPWPVCGFLDH